ncbi:MAG TPA: hypothetical protein VF645_10480 [Allosphingosinicella sp.]
MADDEDISTIGAEPGLSLEELNDWLEHKEGLYGPVIAIGIKADRTATSASFRYEPGQPTKTALIYRKDQASSTVPPGQVKQCEGEALILNAETDVVIYRAP